MRKYFYFIVFVFILIHSAHSDGIKNSNVEEFISDVKSYYYLSPAERKEIESILKNCLLEEHINISGNYVYYDLNSKVSQIGIKITFEDERYRFSEIRNDLSIKRNFKYQELSKNYFKFENNSFIYNTSYGLYALSNIDTTGNSNFYRLEKIIKDDINKINFMNPYNLKMGMSVTEIDNLKKITNMYQYEYYPKEINQFFDRYILWIDDEVGLFYIKTIGYNIYDTDNLKKTVDEIYKIFELNYGKPDIIRQNSYSWYNKGDKKLIWLFIQNWSNYDQIVIEYSFTNKEIDY